jgi:hypothetical protein
LRVRLVLRFRPRSVCCMDQIVASTSRLGKHVCPGVLQTFPNGCASSADCAGTVAKVTPLILRSSALLNQRLVRIILPPTAPEVKIAITDNIIPLTPDQPKVRLPHGSAPVVPLGVV